MANMKKPTRQQLRDAGFKLDPLKPVAIRLAPDTWEKLEWLAAEKGIPRADFVRFLLTNEAGKAKPPKHYENKAVSVTADEWEKIGALAVQHGHESASGFVAELLRSVLTRASQ